MYIRKISTQLKIFLVIFAATGEKIWDKDVRFTVEIYCLIRKLEAELPQHGFKCEKCKKQNSQEQVQLEPGDVSISTIGKNF